MRTVASRSRTPRAPLLNPEPGRDGGRFDRDSEGFGGCSRCPIVLTLAADDFLTTSALFGSDGERASAGGACFGLCGFDGSDAKHGSTWICTGGATGRSTRFFGGRGV